MSGAQFLKAHLRFYNGKTRQGDNLLVLSRILAQGRADSALPALSSP